MDRGTMYAACAGILGSLAAVSGKLAFENPMDDYLLFAVFFCAFLVSNVLMWSLYTRSLATSSSTSKPMIVNMACNFACSGFLGQCIFGEAHSILWWTSLAVLVVGLAMFTHNPSSRTSKTKAQ